jgi:glutamate dehydrogenase
VGLDIVEVAASTSTPVLDVAAVYFALADQLHLTWLRDRILALPRDDRWSALARAALRDDVYSAPRRSPPTSSRSARVLRRARH